MTRSILGLAAACMSVVASAAEIPNDALAELDAKIERGLDRGQWAEASKAWVRALWKDLKSAHQTPGRLGNGVRSGDLFSRTPAVESDEEYPEADFVVESDEKSPEADSIVEGDEKYLGVYSIAEGEEGAFQVTKDDAGRFFVEFGGHTLPAVVKGRSILFTTGKVVHSDIPQLGRRPYGALEMYAIRRVNGKYQLGSFPGKGPAWKELVKRKAKPIAKVVPLAPGSPWDQLSDMPGELGRFALATDGRCIYRLGGVSFNITSGREYGKTFAAFDPATQQWQDLPQAPFGTGGAMLAYWPEKECLVALAGIAVLGDAFDMNGVTVGVYHPGKPEWTTRRIACEGLGRPTWLAPIADGRFLVLSSSRLLATGEQVAELDLGAETLRIVGACPLKGRLVGAARVDKTLFVLMTTGKEPCALHRFAIESGEHQGSIELDQEFSWEDTFFSNGKDLYVWKNSGPYDRNPFQYASQVLCIDPSTGDCPERSSSFPGPQARRSSGGVLCGDAFYAFGGQRTDDVWLSDVYRYRFSEADTPPDLPKEKE